MPAESVCKPLGKGYEGFREFFSRYCAEQANPGSNPDLALSLNALDTEEARDIVRRVGARPLCLIQGITCPRNGVALWQYLAQAADQRNGAAQNGAVHPDIHGIDIMDVATLAREAGTELAHVSFTVGDAARMERWANGSVDILVQDHLLNCAPHGSHEAILREAARVLSSRGVMILNFSVEPEAEEPRLSWCEAGKLLGAPLTEEAYCLRRIAEARRNFIGRVISDSARGRELVVTAPYGNFEFYFPLEQLQRTLDRAGLRFLVTRRVPGAKCVRYRTLVERIAEAAG
jgi:hypothetical protein